MYSYACTRVFIVELLIIIPFWNYAKCPSVVDRLNKFWDLHIMEYNGSVFPSFTMAAVKENVDDLYILKVERPQSTLLNEYRCR